VRCRKARWYLSARCDGTLSERQRRGLEAHLDSCEECRREGFFFSEIGSLATRLESHGTRPDFNLRMRAAIRRADEAAARPVTWPSRLATLVLRPALVAAGVVVLGLGGLGAWSMMRGGEVPQAGVNETSSAVNPRYGLSVRNGQLATQAGELIPVNGIDQETRRLQERYLEAGRLPRDYVMEAVRLGDSNNANLTPRYVLPTMSPDQVTKKVSY